MAKTKKTDEKTSTNVQQTKTVETETPIVDIIEETIEQQPDDEQTVELTTVEEVVEQNTDVEFTEDSVNAFESTAEEAQETSESIDVEFPESNEQESTIEEENKPSAQNVYCAQKPPTPQPTTHRNVYIAQKSF